MKARIKILILLLSVIISNQAIACDCIIINSVEKEFNKSDYVLTGKVLSVSFIQILENGNNPQILTSKFLKEFDIFKGRILAEYRIEVIEIYKGKKRIKEINIYTGRNGGGDCGYYFKIGEKYLIYSFEDSWEVKLFGEHSRKYKNILYTDICTRTKIFNKKEIEEIKLLN
jgi:hypothetical protein